MSEETQAPAAPSPFAFTVGGKRWELPRPNQVTAGLYAKHLERSAGQALSRLRGVLDDLGMIEATRQHLRDCISGTWKWRTVAMLQSLDDPENLGKLMWFWLCQAAPLAQDGNPKAPEGIPNEARMVEIVANDQQQFVDLITQVALDPSPLPAV